MAQVQQRVLAALAAAFLAAPAAARKFYPDDPIRQEPPPLRVEKAKFRKLSDYYDFFLNTFTRPGEYHTRRRRIPAQGVNTLGEVPDGAWYVNRHGARRMSLEELVRGPDTGNPPAMDGPWTVLRAKSEGLTPGLVIEDARGERYWLKFDPHTNPEMATAADVIGSAFFYALGYHVPEYYLVYFRRDQLKVSPQSVFTDALGKRRAMSGRDVEEILLDVPRLPDGRIRAVASRRIPGEELGPFRYHGTRRDDPNDIVPHEHRRELRGLFVFAAWLGHDDARAINTYDSLIEENGLRYIRHYLMDFGSILGSASVKPNSARSGHERLFAWRPAALQLFTLGLWIPRWARAHFPDIPAVGRFEYEIFDPERYKTEYRNPAFENRLPDDTFWAARQVMRFTDEEIRALVRKGQYSDPRAEDWIATCLIRRRDKIGRTYFARVLPLDDIRIEGRRLVFDDLAVRHGFHPPRTYTIAWSRFENEAGRHIPLAGEQGASVPPEALAAAPGEYFAAQIRAEDPSKTVTAYFRKTASGFELVGLDRTW
ncbi:MAG TPA: hypothetical protein VNJ11_14620 [Bryobacteraceae bacterium]|nr:hypothetical protein [Bryobacteraceae bacterium]